MSRDVQLYWSDILEQVCQTEEWNKNYIDSNFLTPTFLAADDFAVYLDDHEANLVEFAKSNGMEVF